MAALRGCSGWMRHGRLEGDALTAWLNSERSQAHDPPAPRKRLWQAGSRG